MSINEIREEHPEIMEDRNIYFPNQRYKNIFELRHFKLKFLLEDLPYKVKNYLFIKYEDLIFDFENQMKRISNYLKIKDPNTFPLNIHTHAYNENIIYNFHQYENNILSKEMIDKYLIKTYEEKLGYI